MKRATRACSLSLRVQFILSVFIDLHCCFHKEMLLILNCHLVFALRRAHATRTAGYSNDGSCLIFDRVFKKASPNGKASFYSTLFYTYTLLFAKVTNILFMVVPHVCPLTDC